MGLRSATINLRGVRKNAHWPLLPIPGTTKLHRLDENIGAVSGDHMPKSENENDKEDADEGEYVYSEAFATN